jgi:glucose dehydrogenase
MNIKHLHGVALFTAGVASLLVGCAFYFLIIGVFEMTAATISLVAFIVLATVIWTKPDKESTRRGSQV